MWYVLHECTLPIAYIFSTARASFKRVMKLDCECGCFAYEKAAKNYAVMLPKRQKYSSPWKIVPEYTKLLFSHNFIIVML